MQSLQMFVSLIVVILAIVSCPAMSITGALKFITFSTAKNAALRVGAMINEKQVLDLVHKNAPSKLWLHLPTSVPNKPFSMQSLIESGNDNVDNIMKVLRSKSEFFEESCLLNIDDVKLEAPIPLPRRNVFCVGKNYKDHIAEVHAAHKAKDGSTSTAPAELPKFPNFFTKAPNCVVASKTNVESHIAITQWLDYEAELAVIIGKPGRDIPREQAYDHVFGYSIGNDITSRDLQRHHNQWFKGKSLDTSCPLGPCIVPSSELSDPHNLKIQLWVNGEKRQDSNTGNMIFDIPEIISQLSKGFTLQPGDVILTGTPDGVGYAMKPPRMLKAGDVVDIEIEGIGRLTNTVV